jgi:hypothetical protein
MGDDTLRTSALTNGRRGHGIGLDVFGFRHGGVTRLPQRRDMININSKPQTAHACAQ